MGSSELIWIDDLVTMVERIAQQYAHREAGTRVVKD
jgi:hypothetical protein